MPNDVPIPKERLDSLSHIPTLTHLKLTCKCDPIHFREFIERNWDTIFANLRYLQVPFDCKITSQFFKPHKNLKKLKLLEGKIKSAQEAIDISQTKPKGFVLKAQFLNAFILKELYAKTSDYLFMTLRR